MTTRPTVVGLISDTHGLLRPEVARIFADVDLIVHAGDVGGHGVLDALRAMAPVEAVSGNVDDRRDPMLARERAFPVQGLTLHVSHGDELGRPTPASLLARYAGDVLIYGHTHRPLTFRDAAGRLVVNPGAAGPRRFNLEPTIAKLTVMDRIVDVELIRIA